MASVTFKRISPSPDARSKATPLPRSSHGLSALHDGKRLVIYGGENVARTPITQAGQSLWLAESGGDDGDEWKWNSLPDGADGPPSRVAHSQAAVGDTIYIFGGRNGIEMGENALNDMWKLEIDDQYQAKWTEITPVGDKRPEARSFQKMIAIGTDLYMFGGCGVSGRLNDLWKFDTIGKQWTSLGSSHVLRGRGGPNILALSGDDDNVKLAMVAGFAGEETNDGHIFSQNKWEDQGMEGLSQMRKRSVCCFGSLPQQNKCLIFGGEVDPSAKGHAGAGGFERDMVLLDGTSGSFLESVKPKEGEEWPEARGWADSSVAGNKFFVFGGLSGDDATPVRLDDLWQCQVSN